jgi:hypothetical protein
MFSHDKVVSFETVDTFPYFQIRASSALHVKLGSPHIDEVKKYCVVTPCITVEAHRCFGGTYCPHLHCRRVSQASNHAEADMNQSLGLVTCLAYSSTLKMEAVCCSETSVNFCWTSWCHITEYSTLKMNENY